MNSFGGTEYIIDSTNWDTTKWTPCAKGNYCEAGTSDTSMTACKKEWLKK